MISKTPFSEHNIRAILELNDIKDFELCSRAGIELEQVTRACGISEGKIIGEPDIEFQVQDGKKLLRFLGSINPDRLDKDLQFRLENFIGRIRIKFLYEKDIANPSRAFKEMLDILCPFSEELKRLKLNDLSDAFLTLNKWQQQGCLGLYRKAREARIFDTVIGPETWDVTVPIWGVEDYWLKACEVLLEMKEANNGKEIFQETRSHLLEKGKLALSKEVKFTESKKAIEHYLGIISRIDI